MAADAAILRQPVVIDNGSGLVKAGIAGEEKPQAVFPSFVGTAKHERCMLGGLDGDT